MKISIITVCYNSAKTVRDALESVWQQKRDGVEIEYIVVDGKSKDNTVEIIKEFECKVNSHQPPTTNHQPSFTFKWISEPDEGLYDAMNKGMKMATGELIGIVNSDDMLNAPDVLERVARYAADGTEVLGGCVRFVPTSTRYENLNETPSARYVNPRFWKKWMLSWGWTPPHPGLYIRKSAYEKYGYYRADCEISADDEIIMRLVRKGGASYKYMPICTVAMRLGGKSTQAKNLILQNKELVQFNKDNGYWCCLPMMFPKLGIKALEIIVPKLLRVFGKMV